MMNIKAERVYNILMDVRGSMELVTAIKLIGYLFLLMKMEQNQASDVYVQDYSMQQLRAHYGNPIGAEHLVSYMRDVEKYYGLKAGIVSTELQYILRDADEETMRYIFYSLSNMDIANEDLARLYDAFIYRAAYGAGKISGLFGTKPSIASIHKGLLQVRPGMSVYDPFCGLGGVVSAVNRETKLYLQDIDMTVTPLAAIAAILHEIPLKAAWSKDSFLHPGQGKRFDRITCFPPMNMRMSRDYILEVCKNNHLDPQMASPDTIATWNALCHIKEDGMAIIQVPAGFLYKGGKKKQFREWAIENKYVDSVVELPSGAVMNTELKTAFVILKMERRYEEVLLIDTESLWTKKSHGNGYFSDESVKRIIEVFNERQESEISTLIDRKTILKNESKLTRQSYMGVERKFELPQLDFLLRREEVASSRYEDIAKKLDRMRKEEVE